MSLKKPFDKLRARRESIAELKSERFKNAKAFFSAGAQTTPPSLTSFEPAEEKWLTLPLTDRWTAKKSKSKHDREKSPVTSNSTARYDVFNSNKGDNSRYNENSDMSFNYGINRPGVTTNAIEQSHELNACKNKLQSARLYNSQPESTSHRGVSADDHGKKSATCCGSKIGSVDSFHSVVKSAATRRCPAPPQRQYAIDLPEYDIITLRNTSIQVEHASYNTKSTNEWSTFRQDTKLSRISGVSDQRTLHNYNTAQAATVECPGISSDCIDMGKQKQQVKLKQTGSSQVSAASTVNRRLKVAAAAVAIEDTAAPRPNHTRRVIDKFEHLNQNQESRHTRRQRGVPSSSNRSVDSDLKSAQSITNNSSRRASHQDSPANYDRVIDQVLQHQRGRSLTQQSKPANNRRSKSLSQAYITRSAGGQQYKAAEPRVDIVGNPQRGKSRYGQPELKRALSVDKYVDDCFSEPTPPIKPILKRKPLHSNSDNTENSERTTPKKKITISFSGSDTDSSELWVRRHDVRRHDNTVFFPAKKPQRPALRSPSTAKEGNEPSVLTHSDRSSVDKNKLAAHINQRKSSPLSATSCSEMDILSCESSARENITPANNSSVSRSNDMQKCNNDALAFTSANKNSGNRPTSSASSQNSILDMQPSSLMSETSNSLHQTHANENRRSTSVKSVHSGEDNVHHTIEGIGRKIFTNNNVGVSGTREKIGLNNHTISCTVAETLDTNRKPYQQLQHHKQQKNGIATAGGANLLNINNSFSTDNLSRNSLLSPGSPRESITKALSHANYRAIWVDSLPDPSTLTPTKPRSQTEAATDDNHHHHSDERFVEGKTDRVIEGQNKSDSEKSLQETLTDSTSKEIPIVIKSAESTDDLIDFSDELTPAQVVNCSEPTTTPVLIDLNDTPSVEAAGEDIDKPLIDMDCSVDFPPPPTDYQLSSVFHHAGEENPYATIPADYHSDDHTQTEAVSDRNHHTLATESAVAVNSFGNQQGVNPISSDIASAYHRNATTECSKQSDNSFTTSRSSPAAQFLKGEEINTADISNNSLQSVEPIRMETDDGVKISENSQVGNKPSSTNGFKSSAPTAKCDSIHTSISIDDDVFLPSTASENAVAATECNNKSEEESIYHTIFLPPCHFSDNSLSSSSAGGGEAKTHFLSKSMNDSANKLVDNSSTMPRADNMTTMMVSADVNTSLEGESGQSTGHQQTQQQQGSLQTALHRVMRDVKTVNYWDTPHQSTASSSVDKFSDSDSVKSEITSPRNNDHLKRTSYAARFSSDTDTTGTSYEQLDAGSEDSTSSQSKKRVTIALKGEVAQKRKVSKNQSLSPRSQKSILKKPVWNPIYDTLPSGGSKADDSDTQSIQSDSALMRRSFSTSNVNGDAPHLRVASEWYVPPPSATQSANRNSSTLPNRRASSSSGSKASYLNLPLRQGKPKDKKSHSLDFIIESAYDSLTDCTSDSMNYRLNKSQSLSRGMHGPRHTQRRSSLADRLTLPARLTKMFSSSKNKKSPAPPPSKLPPMDNYENIAVTLDALYAEWLDGPAKLLPFCEG